ncbi:hypothetical protein LT722_13670 [Pseudomonas syringae pv. syringae]|uniref:hypothetical protein n=1 Tax=Pseudomonas syringae TaxID=317 RepID=UPI001372CF23|nr:hypothetical protein [Pseudomonas syringae]MCK9715922.1 hypothetical protein [Pseudomonas syringae pv. syringae]MCK9762693.1 hypothetical protein [Pseudomonas syringae pv. syringae]NAO28462.1 hypothetical protein [Pseudomonas syringae pv. dysoxyli]
MKKFYLISLLTELKEIYHFEGCLNFDSGIDAVLYKLSAGSEMMNDDEWVQAASIYKTMAGSKSGFSDVYVERGDAEKRVALNVRLHEIRTILWGVFGKIR